MQNANLFICLPLGRAYAQQLVNGIPANSHKSFRDGYEAHDYYEGSKIAGLVKVIRYPGDERFGPIEAALQ